MSKSKASKQAKAQFSKDVDAFYAERALRLQARSMNLNPDTCTAEDAARVGLPKKPENDAVMHYLRSKAKQSAIEAGFSFGDAELG